MEKKFFELIRIAIGAQTKMSHSLSSEEWESLFHIAEKQSMVGICYVGLQIMGADADDGFSRIGMNEELYLNWMGMSAQISMKNEVVNQQCIALQKRLSLDGYRSSILKGQGVARLYGEELRDFRQSGDIDLLVDCSRKEAIDYAQKHGYKIGRWDYKHLDIEFFEDTVVEMHYRPGVSLNLLRNRKLQKFWTSYEEEFYANSVKLERGTIVTPSSRMQTFYIMHHSFRHLISGGIGLRQVMDLYFALLYRSPEDDKWLEEQVDAFGMKSFAEAVVWIIDEVFAPTSSANCLVQIPAMVDLPWAPNEREGRFVLNEVMKGGNFGKGDDRNGKADSRVRILGNIIRRDLHLASHYGNEALMAPLYYVWHFCWKRINE